LLWSSLCIFRYASAFHSSTVLFKIFPCHDFFLSLLPSVVLPLPFKGDISVEVKETDNPATFGLNHVERSWFGEGPTYLWIGKQVET